MTDCLHCEINDLVQQRMKDGETDLGDLAAMMVESLADLILLAPEDSQPTLMAHALIQRSPLRPPHRQYRLRAQGSVSSNAGSRGTLRTVRTRLGMEQIGPRLDAAQA